ncbi:hypothetical protein IWW38_003677, partial [Coemansia aciculifera]
TQSLTTTTRASSLTSLAAARPSRLARLKTTSSTSLPLTLSTLSSRSLSPATTRRMMRASFLPASASVAARPRARTPRPFFAIHFPSRPASALARSAGAGTLLRPCLLLHPAAPSHLRRCSTCAFPPLLTSLPLRR